MRRTMDGWPPTRANTPSRTTHRTGSGSDEGDNIFEWKTPGKLNVLDGWGRKAELGDDSDGRVVCNLVFFDLFKFQQKNILRDFVYRSWVHVKTVYYYNIKALPAKLRS